MKFTKSLLAAAALATSTLAQCNTRGGQITTIEPLVSAWALYLKQVSINERIDEKIANVTVKKNAKDAGHHASYDSTSASAAAGNDEALGAVELEFKAAADALFSKHEAAKAAIEANYQASLTAIAAKATGKQAALDEAIAGIDARIAETETEEAGLNAGVTTHVTGRKQALNEAANRKKAEIEADRAARIATLEGRDTKARANFNAKKASAAERNNAKYQKVHNNIEATKFDTDATLAVLDNAGQEGGVEYPNNCIVQASDAIGMTKAEMTPNEMWVQVVIYGQAQARQAHTEEPTNHPTDAPTDSPTDSPTDAPTTKAPTKSPTKAPTKSPTKAPTVACNLNKPPTPGSHWFARNGGYWSKPQICVQIRTRCDGSWSAYSSSGCTPYADNNFNGPMFQFPGYSAPDRSRTYVYAISHKNSERFYLNKSYQTNSGGSGYNTGGPPVPNKFGGNTAKAIPSSFGATVSSKHHTHAPHIHNPHLHAPHSHAPHSHNPA